MPISEAMRAANRANAQASTGPRTEAGKRRARMNALRHGLSSRDPKTAVLPGEDAAQFAALKADLAARFRPEGDMERELVAEMAAALWRCRRVPAAEIAALVANADEDEAFPQRAVDPSGQLRHDPATRGEHAEGGENRQPDGNR